MSAAAPSDSRSQAEVLRGNGRRGEAPSQVAGPTSTDAKSHVFGKRVVRSANKIKEDCTRQKGSAVRKEKKALQVAGHAVLGPPQAREEHQPSG